MNSEGKFAKKALVIYTIYIRDVYYRDRKEDGGREIIFVFH